MNLNDICQEILAIEEGLACGTIDITFSCDKLSLAMKCGHPVDIFDSIIAELFWDMQAGKEPKKEKVESVIKGLKKFKRNFKVKELNNPIKDLESYLSKDSE